MYLNTYVCINIYKYVLAKLKKFKYCRHEQRTMRLGLWSTSPDWKVARQIVRNGWGLRTNAEEPDKINRELEKILKKPIPITGHQPDRAKILKNLAATREIINKGISRYTRDFNYLEQIKHDTLILESERIKHLKMFEQLVEELQQHMKLDQGTAEETIRRTRELRNKVSSELSLDKSRETFLKLRT